jgi:transmembrane sensor
MLVIGVTVFLLYKNNGKPELEPQLAKTEQQPADLQPGSIDKAVLTLTDGSTIILDQAKDGALATQDNSAILKQEEAVGL